MGIVSLLRARCFSVVPCVMPASSTRRSSARAAASCFFRERFWTRSAVARVIWRSRFYAALVSKIECWVGFPGGGGRTGREKLCAAVAWSFSWGPWRLVNGDVDVGDMKMRSLQQLAGQPQVTKPDRADNGAGTVAGSVQSSPALGVLRIATRGALPTWFASGQCTAAISGYCVSVPQWRSFGWFLDRPAAATRAAANLSSCRGGILFRGCMRVLELNQVAYKDCQTMGEF